MPSRTTFDYFRGGLSKIAIQHCRRRLLPGLAGDDCSRGFLSSVPVAGRCRSLLARIAVQGVVDDCCRALLSRDALPGLLPIAIDDCCLGLLLRIAAQVVAEYCCRELFARFAWMPVADCCRRMMSGDCSRAVDDCCRGLLPRNAVRVGETPRGVSTRHVQGARTP